MPTMLDAFCMLSHLTISTTLVSGSPYLIDKKTKLQRSQVTCSSLQSEWAVELRFEIRFVWFQNSDHSTTFCCLSFIFVSVKPLWESKLPQIYLKRSPPPPPCPLQLSGFMLWPEC